MRLMIFILIVSLSLSFAQEKEKKETGTNTQKPTSLEEKLQIDIDPNVFVYRPMGRRDPFKSLLKGKESKRGAEEGIAGLTISELVLEGIVFGSGEYSANMKGPDNYPYSVKVGDSVYNGKVIEITASTVVFKQILTVALGGTKEKIITKYLNPGEEADKK